MRRAEPDKLMTLFMINAKTPKGQAAELIWSNSLHGANAKPLRLDLEGTNSYFHLIFAN